MIPVLVGLLVRKIRQKTIYRINAVICITAFGTGQFGREKYERFNDYGLD